MSLSTSQNWVPDQNGIVIGPGGRLLIQEDGKIENNGDWYIDGTEVTVNAAQVNTLVDLITTWTGQIVGTPAVVIGAEAANIINVAVQLKDGKATNPTARRFVRVYLSDDAEGDGITGTAATTVAIGTNGTIVEVHTAAKSIDIQTNVTGAFDLNITYSGGVKTWYMTIVQNGIPFTTDAITFA